MWFNTQIPPLSVYHEMNTDWLLSQECRLTSIWYILIFMGFELDFNELAYNFCQKNGLNPGVIVTKCCNISDQR